MGIEDNEYKAPVTSADAGGQALSHVTAGDEAWATSHAVPVDAGGSESPHAVPAETDGPELSHTIALKVAYDGAPFSGFARQPEDDVHTVQGELEDALTILYHREVPTVCAGRTDAGVHALGQVVSFDVTDGEFSARALPTLARSLNAICDRHIAVPEAREVPFGFSARFDASWREYHYHLCLSPGRPVLVEGLVWHMPGRSLDLDAMRQAARLMVGEHDFKSFCVTSSARMMEQQGRSTSRNVIACDVYREQLVGQDVVTVRVVGNAFLHSMVRTMVGTLVEVGRGAHEPGWVADVIAARDRAAAGQTAPAQGLVFWRVGYGDEPVSEL